MAEKQTSSLVQPSQCRKHQFRQSPSWDKCLCHVQDESQALPNFSEKSWQRFQAIWLSDDFITIQIGDSFQRHVPEWHPVYPRFFAWLSIIQTILYIQEDILICNQNSNFHTS